MANKTKRNRRRNHNAVELQQILQQLEDAGQAFSRNMSATTFKYLRKRRYKVTVRRLAYLKHGKLRREDRYLIK